MDDLLAACEDLAANVAAPDTAAAAADQGSHVSRSDQALWKILFGFSSDEAAEAIRNWRADFTRQTISQAAWLLAKEAKMAEGYNKEAYEYSLWRARTAQKPLSHNHNTVQGDGAKYLIKLECGSSPSTEAVDLMRFLPKKPNILNGIDDDGNTTRFCILSSSQKMTFLNALSNAHPSFQPTLIRTSIASKDLSATSSHPTLGVDATLPQFRPDNSSSFSPRPAQDEYPVWYFFYGTLADAGVLSRVVVGPGDEKAAADICYKRARVRRGRLTCLGEKYLALVDADEGSVVDGWAYQVKDRAEEDSLRVYETGMYEVVRCTVEVMGEKEGVVHGLTFRLAKGI